MAGGRLDLDFANGPQRPLAPSHAGIWGEGVRKESSLIGGLTRCEKVAVVNEDVPDKLQVLSSPGHYNVHQPLIAFRRQPEAAKFGLQPRQVSAPGGVAVYPGGRC